MNIIKQLY